MQQQQKQQKRKLLSLYHEFAAPSTKLQEGDYEMARSYLEERNEEVECNADFIPKVFDHFSQTISHRLWIMRAFHLVDLTHVFPPVIREMLLLRVKHHDLSKFSAIEVMGYAARKFGSKEEDLNKKDWELWEKALEHHYFSNDHHPQFNPKDHQMSYLALQESVLDMLACRMERSITPHSTSLTNIFDVPKLYLERYHSEDRIIASSLLQNWCKACIDMVRDSSSLDSSSSKLDIMDILLKCA